MLKITILSILLLLLVGCTSEDHPNVKRKMFQSVNANEATLVQTGKEKKSCYLCGMDLVKFYKTSHTSQHENTHYQYCSIHCLEDHLGKGITLKNPKVVDLSSLKLISVAKAYYVVGSNKRGTMSRVSKYAFSQEEDAKKFQAEFGGEIMDFNGAREKAQEDFKHYRN